MGRIFTTLFLICLCNAGAAAPKACISGAELLRLGESASATQFSQATDCLGYVTGLSDMHEAFVDLKTFKRQWCWPAWGFLIVKWPERCISTYNKTPRY
jgi:hypothetical protein